MLGISITRYWLAVSEGSCLGPPMPPPHHNHPQNPPELQLEARFGPNCLWEAIVGLAALVLENSGDPGLVFSDLPDILVPSLSQANRVGWLQGGGRGIDFL